MKDDGVVPRAKLSVTELTISHNDVLIVKSPSPSATPTWKSVTLTPVDAKKVTVTPVDKNGKQVDTPTEVTPDSKKATTPLTVTLDKLVDAHHLVVIVTPTGSEKTHVNVISVVSCMPDVEGNNFVSFFRFALDLLFFCLVLRLQISDELPW